MKKGMTTLLVILLAVGAMLVSCKAEVGTPADELVSASFELGSSRALSATLEQFNPENYYWKYAAKKNVADTSGLNSGATNPYSEAGALWVKTGTQGPVKGLAGYKVPDFSQGLWDFMLFAYKDADGDELIYQGEATAATLVKGGENLVHVVVSPAPIGNGILFIGETTLKPRDTHDSPTVSRFPKVEDLDGHEYTPTSGTTYELEAGAYKVTVTYKASGIVYAEGTVMATIYPNMTTTVTGSVDELVTYAQFEAEQNPDIIARTAEATGIRANDIVSSGKYTLQDTSATTTVPAVVTATIPEAAAKALIGSTDPSATMALALNVDTTDSTSTSVTYEIGMTKTVTVNSQSTTSDVSTVSDWVTVEISLRTGLSGVAVTHDGHPMVESTDTDDDQGYGIYSYNATTGKLTIVTKTFSPFGVTFDGETAGVAEVNGVKYATLKAAVEAASAGDTVKLLCNTDGAGMTINKNLTIDLNGKTYTGTKDPAGSSGTKTQLFQLLVGNTITIKNGTLTSTSGSGMKMLVQNYSNLTLTGVVLDGTNIGDGQYALSINCGTVVLNGATSIIASNGGRAFDSCKYGSYATPEVTVNTTGTIKGIIELSGGKLEILGGNFEGSVSTVTGYTEGDAAFKGGIYNYDPTAYVPAGYKVEEIEEGRYKVHVDAEIEVVTGTTEPVYMSFLDFAASVNDGDDYEDCTVTLLHDIDLEGKTWTPIGLYSAGKPFKGTFFGGGHTIKNLTANLTAVGDGEGLFGYTQDATISNLTIKNFDLTVGDDAGILVGTIKGNTNISNISIIDSQIVGGDPVGGLVGICRETDTSKKTIIKDCSIDVNTVVKSSSDRMRAGGFVGGIKSGSVMVFEGCSFNGKCYGEAVASFIAHDLGNVKINYQTFINCSAPAASTNLFNSDGTGAPVYGGVLVGRVDYGPAYVVDNLVVGGNQVSNLTFEGADATVGVYGLDGTTGIIYMVKAGEAVKSGDVSFVREGGNLVPATPKPVIHGDFTFSLDQDYALTIIVPANSEIVLRSGGLTPIFENAVIVGSTGSTLRATCIDAGNNKSFEVSGTKANFYDPDGGELTVIKSGYWDIDGTTPVEGGIVDLIFDWDSQLKGWKLRAEYAYRYKQFDDSITFALGNLAEFNWKFIIDDEPFDTYTITTTASTWAELISEGVNITIAHESDLTDTVTFPLSEYNGYVINAEVGIAVMTSSDIYSQDDLILSTDYIVKGSTYYINGSEG